VAVESLCAHTLCGPIRQLCAVGAQRLRRRTAVIAVRFGQGASSSFVPVACVAAFKVQLPWEVNQLPVRIAAPRCTGAHGKLGVPKEAVTPYLYLTQPWLG